ncbi:solute:sodium symporter family transporter [Photobacterium lutimaris]|uniref:Solute:sodium symporter family transporter n=1 Tax=Photobacterium lutimaris TaxID=388278 RepID=A0A2T3J2S3_9GAMM|nr:solute:sodium symporter family transporter [Photobacterium lutimaris]PSU35553.1 solute:sodium symporter family transporter [Photobacterium lutimaris]TDR78604.1 SSS family solute:Na+ symporter [Photobacterium lutimaris]
MNTWILVSFVLFTAFVAVVSWIATKKEDLKSSSGYFLGGRGLTGISIGCSILLTNWSADQLIGLNGQGYAFGLSNMGWPVTSAIAFILMATVFLPYFLKTGITTIPELIERRFGATTRNVIAVCILINMAAIALPAVVYAGALGMSKVFNVSELLGISDSSAIVLSIILITLIGSIYSIFGGLKAVVVSDTINGIGFFIGSILVLIVALQALGGGDFSDGMYKLVTENQHMLNAVTAPTVTVPFSALFTGMILVNVYFACTNQVIIQRALGAKNLEEGQKGVLIAALIKIISIAILIFPGIIAFHLYGHEGIHGDEAYPILINRLLPSYMIGIFGAILFGAVISTFNSTINSCSTIFALNIYKPLCKKEPSAEKCITAGKYFGAFLGIFSALVAPYIKNAPDGIYMFFQEFNSILTVPMLLMIIVGMLSKRATPKATISGGATYVALYLFFKFGYQGLDLHFLHQSALFFTIGAIVTLVMTHIEPAKEEIVIKQDAPVEVKNWKHLRLANIVILVIMVATYALASPIGIVTEPENILRNVLVICVASVISIFGLNLLCKKYLRRRSWSLLPVESTQS